MAPPKGHPPYPGCETGGRPLYWTQERIDELRLKFEAWLEDPKNFWFGDFAYENDVDRDILADCSKKCNKFLRTYKKAIQNQENRILKGGLFNVTNPTVSIFALKCNHKWVDGEARHGIEETQDTKSTRSLDTIKQVAVDHANIVEQAGDQPS